MIAAAVAPPLAVYAVQSLFWTTLTPYAWFLSYPAMLASAWIGGTASGIAATLLATCLVWWRFLPPERTLAKDEPGYILSALVFLAVGSVVSVLQGRLVRARREQSKALADTEQAAQRLQEAREELETARREQAFLAEAGAVLGSTIDPRETLVNIGQLALRELADVCTVDVVQPDGSALRVKVLSKDAANEGWCRVLEGIVIDRPSLVQTVMRTGKPLLQRDMTPALLDSIAQSPLHRQALAGLAPVSAIVLPLAHRERLLGVLSLTSTDPSHHYTEGDMGLAEELARRAAFALDNSRLYDLAQRATKARDDMLGVVAHDLRNPLGVVLMQARLLRRGAVDADRRRRMADAVEHAAQRMNRLIEDLLDRTLFDAGKLILERGALSPEEIVRQIVEAEEGLARASAVELVEDVAPALRAVLADRHRLQQVFENLVGNALRFTGAGGRITVGAAPRESEILFWVSDTGTGMTAETLDHVFDRFWRDTTRRGGAGLGLSIAKGIVQAHGGRIWAESTLGRGSSFFFTIPAAPAVETRSHTPAPTLHS